MYYNKMLSGPLPIDLSSLDDDPLEMPAILKNGAFATQKTVDLFDPVSTFASSILHNAPGD